MVPGFKETGMEEVTAEKEEDTRSGVEILWERLCREEEDTRPGVEILWERLCREEKSGSKSLDGGGEDTDGFRPPDDSGEDEDSLKLSDNGGRDSSHSTDAPAKDKDKDTPQNDSPYDKDGKLIPSNNYELNGYYYQTDKQGRIISTSGSLSLGQAERNRNAQKKVGKLGGDSGYDGGHIIGKQFGGDGNIGNLIPMKSELNQAGGDYYKMEKELKDALLEGRTVSIDVQMEYDGDSAVPSKIIATYQIDGELVKKVFDNL